jgi:hypothetical protein
VFLSQLNVSRLLGLTGLILEIRHASGIYGAAGPLCAVRPPPEKPIKSDD